MFGDIRDQLVARRHCMLLTQRNHLFNCEVKTAGSLVSSWHKRYQVSVKLMWFLFLVFRTEKS